MQPEEKDKRDEGQEEKKNYAAAQEIHEMCYSFKKKNFELSFILGGDILSLLLSHLFIVIFNDSSFIFWHDFVNFVIYYYSLFAFI